MPLRMTCIAAPANRNNRVARSTAAPCSNEHPIAAAVSLGPERQSSGSRLTRAERIPKDERFKLGELFLKSFHHL